jgi:N-glycosylase/DNA lyase
MNVYVSEIISSLPHPDDELMNGVKWGRCDQLFTPAYWKIQYHLFEDNFSQEYYRISQDLLEEVCACILGGYGIRSEIGMIAFERLRDLELLKPGTPFSQLFTALLMPLYVGGNWIRYRFPKQKAKYLAALLNRHDLSAIPAEKDLALREWLVTVDGIGMKTASWITRNWLNSQNVAILDIHIYRAGLLAGFFMPTTNLARDYRKMEAAYLNFSSALGVNAANLDALIWLQLKETNHIALDIIKNNN